MTSMSILEAAAKLRAREVSSVELTRESLGRIYEWQPRLNAFITVTEDLAVEQARRADEELARGVDRGPLHGIPYALKDNYATAGILTTCGSKILRDNKPASDSAVCEKLREAGAVLMGKTGLHEWAYGITSDNPHFGAIRNPRDPARIPGGSSGGSGVAVAAGMIFFSIGSDTGGSIRIPAACCGCVGLKPTLGLVDTRGLMPLSPTLDHAGPLTRTIGDAAVVMNAIAARALEFAPVEKPRVGVPRNFYNERVAPPIAQAFETALRNAEAAGAALVPLLLPDPEEVNAIGRTILLKEAVVSLKAYLDRREDIGADVLALLDQGCKLSGADYARALDRRLEIQVEWGALWGEMDVLFTPTMPIESPLIGAENVRLECTRFVRAFNVLGFPALSIPLETGGLPCGLQMVAKAGSEARLTAIANRLQYT